MNQQKKKNYKPGLTIRVEINEDIEKVLETIHNDNLEIKNSIVELNKSIQNISTITPTIRTKPKEIIEIKEILEQPSKTIKPIVKIVNEINPENIQTYIKETIQIPQEEQPLLSVKDQIQLALRKKQLDNSAKELRCFQPEHQPVFLAGNPEDQKLLKNFKPDTGGLIYK
jgi:hypothetical protein